MIKRIIYLFSILLLVTSACSPSDLENDSLSVESNSDTITPQPTDTIEPTSTVIPPTETPNYQSHICSPLEDETLGDLPEIITQEFKIPRAGQDDGHHGVDFAFYRRRDLLSIDGVGVNSILEGEVVTVINDKYPYGNAVLIETPITSIDPDLLERFIPQSIEPTVMPDPKFNWIPVELPFELSKDSRSLYIYYAHFKYPADVTIGDKVACGQEIGQVGNTGDSSNPHLHLEIRVGPSGARFESMAYYTAQSTETERYNYVTWRVSNLFQLIDPMLLLSANE